MKRFLEGYGALLSGLGRGERWVALVMLAVIVGCIFAQVVSRYLFGRPLVWVEELSTYAFIWGAFIGAAAGLKQGRHIKIQSFVGLLPAVLRDTIRVGLDLMIGAFCALLVANGIQAMLIFEWSQRTIALPVELPRYLFYSTPLILGAASMTMTVLYDLLLVLAGGHRAPQAEEALTV
jgi:TRAP-type transport system small permease protein